MAIRIIRSVIKMSVIDSKNKFVKDTILVANKDSFKASQITEVINSAI